MTYYSIGKKLYKEKKYKEAAEFFKLYIKSSGVDEIYEPIEWHTMARCFDKAGLYRDAMHAYLNLSHYTFMEIPDPDAEIHIECLAYFIKYKQPDVVGIIESLYLFDQESYHPYYFYAMSAWYFHLEKNNLSMKFLKKGLEFDATASEILFKFNPEMKKSQKYWS
jgi:tetratricopeptide (TPR) repeat protein